MPSADIATALENIVLITFGDEILIKRFNQKITHFRGYFSLVKIIVQAKFRSYIINLAKS